MTDAALALDAIGQLPDQEIDVAEAALQLARRQTPMADWLTARAHLSALARDMVALASLVPAVTLGEQAACLSRLIAGRFGYGGDTDTYNDLANGNLIRVTERRRGLPVALGIVWMHAAGAAGWNAHGVDFPGHFLVALSGGGEQLLLDVFAGGQPLDAQALRRRLKQLDGASAELRPGQFQPMTARAVLVRLQYNIQQRRLAAGDLAGALDCTEDILRIAPGQAAMWRDAALMHQRLHQVGAALRCFGRFLELVPDGPAAGRVRAAVAELRSRLN